MRDKNFTLSDPYKESNPLGPVEEAQQTQLQKEILVQEQGGVLTRFGKALITTPFGTSKRVLERASTYTTPYISPFFEAVEAASDVEVPLVDKAALFEQTFNEQNAYWNDPEWSPATNKDQLEIVNSTIKELGVGEHSRAADAIRGANSEMDLQVEAGIIRKGLEEAELLASLGTAGNIGAFIGGAVDIDTVLGLGVFSKGLQAAKLARIQRLTKIAGAGKLASVPEAALAGAGTSRIGNAIRGAASGVVAMGGVQAAELWASPLHDAESFGTSLMLGGALGALGGTSVKPIKLQEIADLSVARKQFAKEAEAARQSPEAVQARSTREANKQSIQDDIDALNAMNYDKSVGAGSVTPELLTSNVSKAIREDSYNYFLENPHYDRAIKGLGDFVDEDANPVQATIQKATQKMYEGLQSMNLNPTFDRAMNSGNVVLERFGAQLLNDSMGRFVNHSNGDNIADEVENLIKMQYAPYHQALFKQWVNETGRPASSIMGNLKEAGRTKQPKAFAEFSRDVQGYVVAKGKGDEAKASQYPQSVQDMGARVNEAYKEVVRQHHKAGTDDFADIEVKDWHMQHNWRTDKMMEFESKLGSKRVLNDLSEAIRREADDPNDPLIPVWALAIVKTTKRKEFGLYGPMGNVRATGKQYLVEALEESGVAEHFGRDPAEWADQILFENSDRGKIKAARSRIKLDVTTPLGDEGHTVLDLMDHDIIGQLDRTARGHANEIGRVRGTGGFLQRRNLDSARQAVMDEAQEVGNDVAEDLKTWDHMMTMFDERAYNGGINPIVNRMNRLPFLSYMSQGGLAGLSEIGIGIGIAQTYKIDGAIGRFKDIFIKSHKNADDRAMIDALSHGGKYFAPEELMTTTMELDNVSSMASSTLGKKLDGILDVATRVVGQISGLYHVHGSSQQWASEIHNNLFYKTVLNPDSMSAKRKAFHGIDEEITRIVNKYKDYFEVDKDGGIIDNHFEKWDLEDIELWRRAISRQVDSTIQSRRRGEEHQWQFTDWGATFFTLRSFALQAFHSKGLSAGRLADQAAAASFTWQLGTAALAVAAKFTINGEFDKLNPEDIGRRALGWGAYTSPFMILLDPALDMMGIDYVTGQNYHQFHRSELGPVPTPAAFSVIADYANMMRTSLDFIDDGKLDWESANAWKSFPVIGRMYGMQGVMSLME